MSRVALVTSEPIRARMAGIGIRYLEIARRLPALGVETVLVGRFAGGGEAALEGVETRPFASGRLAALLEDCDVVVAQGQLANDCAIELADRPLAIDLYDPWLVENLSYAASLGPEVYRNDHASWMLQLARGDFFLCSCEEQRLFYLGLLTALGRVNPERYAVDPDLTGLVTVVPFGVPDELPPHRPWLPPAPPEERRILFGGLYDWYDPWTLLAALERITAPPWRLLLIRSPNPESTPQSLLAEVETWCRRRGWWGERVEALDWIPFERRFDLLREVDILVSTHRPALETELSLRTRFLEGLAAEVPIVATEGGAMSRMLRVWDAGWVVPPGDVDALATTLAGLLASDTARVAKRDGSAALAARFRWSRVLAPLAAFCRAPRRDGTRERWAAPLPTRAPAPGLAFRLGRRWRRWRDGR